LTEVRLQNMTWEDFRARLTEGSGVCVLPVGSTEQHGPHLPLGTDTMVAIAVSEEAAARTGSIVAPPLWFGWSPHHMILPGTITIRPEILTELVCDVVQSLVSHGCTRFVFLNGHRIVNIAWLQIAAERCQRTLGVRVKLFDPAFMSKDIVDQLGFGPVRHAEEIESSHMLHCYPSLCHLERAMDYIPEGDDLYKVDPRLAGDTSCYVPSTIGDMQMSVVHAKGVTGSPTHSSPESGKAYHEHIVNRLVQVIDRIKERS